MQRSDRRRSKIRQRRTRRGIGAAVASVALVGLVLGGLLPAGAEESEPVVDEPTTTTSSTLAEPPIETPTEPPVADTPLVAAAEVTPQAADQQVVALASATYDDFPLHNTTAGVGTDCPDTENDYWHFVVTPNNGNFSFVQGEIHLDLGSGLQSFSYLPNGSQTDNVFVLVPPGFELTDLVGGNADIFSQNGNAPKNFNLSHLCVGGDQELGSLEVTKVMLGTPDGNDEGYPFTVTVDCTDGEDSLPGFPKQHVFEAPEPDASNPWVIGGIPAGSECTTTEPDSKGATLDIDPEGSVTIVDNETEAVTVTNTYDGPDTGGLTVSKTVFGPVPDGTEFTVTVTCGDLDPFVLVFDAGGNQISGPAQPMTGLEVGTECHVEETGTDGTTPIKSYRLNTDQETATPPDVVIGTTTQSVEVINSYVAERFGGSVKVEKRVLGGPPPDPTQFVINVTCTGTLSGPILQQDITLTYPAQLTRTLGFDASATETVTCTVKEVSPLGGAVKASISPNGGVIELTISAPAADVVVTNDYGDPEVQVGGTSVQSLPFTGSTTNVLVTTAAALLAAGAALWFVTRRRRSASGLA